MADTTTPFPFRVRARAAGDWDVPDIPGALSQLGVTRVEARLNEAGAEDGATCVMTFYVGAKAVPLELRGTPGLIRERWWVIDLGGVGYHSPETGSFADAVVFYTIRFLALQARAGVKFGDPAAQGEAVSIVDAIEDLRRAEAELDVDGGDPDPDWVVIRASTRDTILAWFDRLAPDLRYPQPQRKDPT